MSESPLIVALDHDDLSQALSIVDRLEPRYCRVKVANTLFVRYGPACIEALHTRGFDVFLDLKFHDIPSQVAGSCRAAASLKVWMLTVHIGGGHTMLMAAREAVEQATKAGERRPLLVGVTLLTSLKATDLTSIGIAHSVETQVEQLARLAQRCQLDGVVTAATDITIVRQAVGENFLLVTPGIRCQQLNSVAHDDQQRVLDASQAQRLGANYLVVGRPITLAADPNQALQVLYNSLTSIKR